VIAVELLEEILTVVPTIIAAVIRSRFKPPIVTFVPAGTVLVPKPAAGAVTNGAGAIYPE
jgi:hypothetical protein